MILCQSLWNNSLIITSDSRTLFNDSLFKKGVAFLNDLVDDLGKILGNIISRKGIEANRLSWMVWHFKCNSKGMENVSKKLL